jgi:chaperonin GroEL (HSP60 family)
VVTHKFSFEVAFMEVDNNHALYRSVLVGGCVLSVVKTLLGPNPAGKLIIEASGEGTITSNTLEVLNLISIKHPAIQILREICVGQKKSVGTVLLRVKNYLTVRV